MDNIYYKVNNIQGYYNIYKDYCSTITQLNIQVGGQYCVPKMKQDYLWLSPEKVERMSKQYNENIHEINITYDLETGKVNGDHWKDTHSFTESLFMLYSFFNGSLWGAPNNEHLCSSYIYSSKVILKELCKRGVYTIHGNEPNKIMRSTYNFIVMINDIVKDEFLKLLKCLYSRDVNVCCRQVKNGKIVGEYVYAFDSGMLIYTDNFKLSLQLPNGFHSPSAYKLNSLQYSELYTQNIDPFFGMNGMTTITQKSKIGIDSYYLNERRSSETHSLFYVETWSRSSEAILVEDILLQLWLGFNSSYGHMNEV
jgi:hypothetical protein